LSRHGHFADVPNTRLIELGRKSKPETACVLDAFEANRQRVTPSIRRRREAGRLDFLAIEPCPYPIHRVAERVAWSNAHHDREGIAERHGPSVPACGVPACGFPMM
jgi:hypothetical protein